MAYVSCHDCKRMVHFKPIDVEAFDDKYIKNEEPIYCLNCFQERKVKGVIPVEEERDKGLPGS